MYVFFAVTVRSEMMRQTIVCLQFHRRWNECHADRSRIVLTCNSSRGDAGSNLSIRKHIDDVFQGVLVYKSNLVFVEEGQEVAMKGT